VTDGCRPAELYDRLAGQLPRYALPSYVLLVDDLPRTPTQKVRKAELRGSVDLSAAWRPTGRRSAGTAGG
jgi:crotonobetaine/carnitine-CoA ligase